MLDLKKLQDFQFGFTIGIRFRNNFVIEDNFGDIIDTILYKKNSFFTPQKFPVVLSNGNERILYNESTKNRIVINPANIILDVCDQKDFSEEKSRNQFGEQIINNILSNNRIERINRIGYVLKYLITDKDIKNEFRKRVTSNHEIKNVNLQFTQKKSIDQEAKIHRNVSDYYNIIYTFTDTENNSDALFLSVDFQRIYVPPLETVIGLNYESFINAVQSYKSEIISLLNKNYGKDENGQEKK